MADASKVLLTEGDAPATPAAGVAAFYVKTDHKFYTKGSDGVEQSAGTGIVTASGTPEDNEYAKWTSATDIEGRTYAEVKTDLGGGTIADDAMLQVDDASAADDDFARFTAAGIEGISAQTALSALLAAVLLENDSIKLDPALSADGKWNGITETGVAGATLAFGDLVYLQTADSRWELASADNAATGCNFKLGICVLVAANDGSATDILLWGKVRADTAFPALTIGAPVFMSTTAGDVQVAAPTGTTDIVRIMGYGNTADELFFCPENDWLKLVQDAKQMTDIKKLWAGWNLSGCPLR